MSCQPASRSQACHTAESASSRRAIAGVRAIGGEGCGTAWGCAESGPAARALIMAQARTNAFGEFFDVIGFLERGHGEDKTIVLFKVGLELCGKAG